MHRTPRIDPALKRADLIQTHTFSREVFGFVTNELRRAGLKDVADAMESGTVGTRIQPSSESDRLVQRNIDVIHTANLIGMRLLGYKEYGYLSIAVQKARKALNEQAAGVAR